MSETSERPAGAAARPTRARTERAASADAGDRPAGAGAGAPRPGGAGAEEWRARGRAGIELLRPHPHRGDLIAAGAVPLTVGLLLVQVRLDERWGDGVLLLVSALACALVLGMGVLAPLEGDRPRAYQVVLQLCGLVLLLVTLLRLAQGLGVEDPLDASGASFWIFGVLAGAAAWLARQRRNAFATLVAGIAAIFAGLAFVDWAFSPQGPGTQRWILLLLAIGLLVGALLLRDRHRRESVYLIDAAGLATFILGYTFLGELLLGVTVIGGDGFAERVVSGPGTGWKLVLLAAGLGLVAYAGVDREAGPGWLGALNLLAFVLLVGVPGEGGPSLWFWPLVLLGIGAAMIAIGLRPREPLPPEPTRAGGPAPVVPAPVAPRPASPSADAHEPPNPVERRESATPPGPAHEPPPAPGREPAEPPAAPEPDEAPRPVERRESATPPGPAHEPPPAPAPSREEPADAQATRPQDAVAPAAEDAGERPVRAGESAGSDPEPPARGSLWARADPGEQPTQPHRVSRPDATDA